ncbi:MULTISPECIES: hypothetical protein [unclassified Neochlamydia]|nr:MULTISPECIES: hypothetical protein [unclassified Neochlamydia]
MRLDRASNLLQEAKQCYEDTVEMLYTFYRNQPSDLAEALKIY